LTERIYLNDSTLLEFESAVKSIHRIERGFEIILVSSAFYPDSGGQNCDSGFLDNRGVISVYDNDNGDVVHLIEIWESPSGTVVRGMIDRERRLDNMRKHTGQHILSRAFLQIAAAETVSSHLGEIESTIELSTPALDEAVLHQAEDLANRIIMENHPVKIGYFTREQLNSMPIRKIPDLEGEFRIIQIGEFDYTACGGTHCRNTGEVGLLKIIAQEKMRGHLRVVFLAGRQALDDYRAKSDVIGRLSRKLTCHYNDLPAAADNLLAREAAYRKEISELNSRLLPLEVSRLEESAIQIGVTRVVVETYDRKDQRYLKELANAVTQNSGQLCLFMADDKLILAASKEGQFDASELARLFIEKLGGKGGGNAMFAQIGGIPSDRRRELLDSFVNIIKMRIAG